MEVELNSGLGWRLSWIGVWDGGWVGLGFGMEVELDWGLGWRLEGNGLEVLNEVFGGCIGSCGKIFKGFVVCGDQETG